MVNVQRARTVNVEWARAASVAQEFARRFSRVAVAAAQAASAETPGRAIAPAMIAEATAAKARGSFRLSARAGRPVRGREARRAENFAASLVAKVGPVAPADLLAVADPAAPEAGRQIARQAESHDRSTNRHARSDPVSG
jgi:hypothetical protein